MEDRYVVAAGPGAKVIGLMTHQQVVTRLATGALTPEHYCVPAEATGDLSGQWRTLAAVFGHVPPAEPASPSEEPASPSEEPAQPTAEHPVHPARHAERVLSCWEGFGELLLTFGQFVSVLGCCAAAVYPWVVLTLLREPRAEMNQNAWLLLFGGAAAACAYSAAMFVVFTRAKLFRGR